MLRKKVSASRLVDRGEERLFLGPTGRHEGERCSVDIMEKRIIRISTAGKREESEPGLLLWIQWSREMCQLDEKESCHYKKGENMIQMRA